MKIFLALEGPTSLTLITWSGMTHDSLQQKLFGGQNGIVCTFEMVGKSEIFFLYCCDRWEYIVTFTQVITMYQIILHLGKRESRKIFIFIKRHITQNIVT
jgi:hypothetical protein